VQLGGKDWDQRIIDYAAEQFRAKHGIDPREHPESLQELIVHAEQAKIRLSKLAETRLTVNCDGRREVVPLTRSRFEEITHDLLAQTDMTLRLTIEEAGLNFSDIDESLLVGGSTRMRAVMAMFERLIGSPPRQVLNPDECVAQGAAIHAVMTQLKLHESGEGVGSPEIRPEALAKFRAMEERLINSHTLGIQALDAEGKTVVAAVIPRASNVPCRQTRIFRTSRPGQTAVRISVMEGESSNPEACTEIGALHIRGLPKNLPQGTAIEVQFEYTQDSRIQVSAGLPSIGQAAQTDIQRTSGMSPSEIERAGSRIAALKVE
jgi:molecular chaperone DnaK